MPLIIILVAAAVLLFWALTSITGFVLFTIVPWILLGLIAGWVASQIVRSRNGLGQDVLIGIAGSVIGGALFSLLFHINTGGVLSLPHLLVSIVGAVLLLGVMRVVQRPRYL